jgi:hypothetical protein
LAGDNKKVCNIIGIEHAHRETTLEKKIEICATNLANKTKFMSTNAKTWERKTHFLICVVLSYVLILICEDIIALHRLFPL